MAETLRTSARLSLAVLASRILGVVREALFAALFGAGQLADAYQVAFRIPNLLRDLFAEGALSSAFVPTFTAVLAKEGREHAHRLGNLALTAVTLITGLLSLLGVLYAENVVVLISAGFAGDQAKVELAARLTRVMMPLLSVVSLGAVWMGMLNAQRRYMAPASAPAVFNLASIAAGVALFFVGLAHEEGVYWWSVGTLAAGVAQAVVQVPWLWRMGYRPLPRVVGLVSDPGIRRILRLMAPAVVGLAAIQINIFINTRFASDLGDGPVGYLAYAFRLFYLPVGIFGVALATVTTTRVAEDAARGDRSQLVARTGEGMRAVWVLTSASAVGLFVLAEPVVALIYQRGAFVAADTSATAWVLRAYLLGLVPYSLVKMLAPAFYSLDRARIPLAASVTAVLVNVTFNGLTYERFGAPGIALGTTLGAVANVLVLRIAFSRVVGAVPDVNRMRRGLVVLTANLAMALVAWGSWIGLDRAGAVLRRVIAIPTSLTTALALVLVIIAGFLSYVGILHLGRHPDAGVLWALPRRILGRVFRGRDRAT